MSNLSAVSRWFGEAVQVTARKTTQDEIDMLKRVNMTGSIRADVHISAVLDNDLSEIEAIAAALLEAVAFARAVNQERGVE